jgi:hypothetical protein
VTGPKNPSPFEATTTPPPQAWLPVSTTRPPVRGDKTEWPTPTHDLVEAYGSDVVFQTGLDLLGWPPTWILRDTDPGLTRLRDRLAQHR